MQVPDFSKIFHQSSKNHFKGHPPVLWDEADWPEEWKTTFYKTYPRFAKIDLVDEVVPADFFDLVKKRRSRRDFNRVSLAKRELSLLLKYSCGNIGSLEGPWQGERFRRAQPSGGALFPIEVYPIIFRSGGDLKSGLYHYNVKHHQLDVLWEREFSDEDLDSLFNYPFAKDAALSIVLTAVFRRNQNKYGERGYRYILLEAGHIGQNIYLVSEALGLKCCAVTGTKDENVEKLIDIDGVTESVVYSLVVGK